MDLLATLRSKLDALDEGDYLPGLCAVLVHIETAFKHLERGQQTGDETSFTDAIYRTNQAFEGSIKEAYRVLAGKTPDHMSPFEIEGYLEKNEVLRPRVLSLFKNYRTSWRNPSTHDYKLDFDEGEAFLAIISVTAFTCILLDQVAERLAFVSSKNDTENKTPKLKLSLVKETDPLADKLAWTFVRFAEQQSSLGATSIQTESQLVGAITGFLSAIAPEYRLVVDAQLVEARPERADLLVRGNEEQVIVELKRARCTGSVLSSALAQLEHYLIISNSKSGILYFADESASTYEVIHHLVPHGHGRVLIVRPKGQPNVLRAPEHEH